MEGLGFYPRLRAPEGLSRHRVAWAEGLEGRVTQSADAGMKGAPTHGPTDDGPPSHGPEDGLWVCPTRGHRRYPGSFCPRILGRFVTAEGEGQNWLCPPHPHSYGGVLTPGAPKHDLIQRQGPV